MFVWVALFCFNSPLRSCGCLKVSLCFVSLRHCVSRGFALWKLPCMVYALPFFPMFAARDQKSVDYDVMRRRFPSVCVRCVFFWSLFHPHVSYPTIWWQLSIHATLSPLFSDDSVSSFHRPLTLGCTISRDDMTPMDLEVSDLESFAAFEGWNHRFMCQC